ncbi:hypothetical protein [Spirosoma areae]
MKKLVFILALLANSYLAACQNNVRSGVKAGITYILFGRGDLSGFNYYNEYNRKFNRFLTFAPSLHVGYGSKMTLLSGADGFNQELRFTKVSFALDANLFVSPMRFERNKIRLGVGPSIRFFSDSFPSSYGLHAVDSPGLPGFTYALLPIVYSRPQNYWTIGYTVVLEGELTVSSRWITGARGSFQNYQSGETATNVGFNIGYRF